MLAPSVSCFAYGADYEPSSYDKSLSQDIMPNYEMTNAGLRIQLPVRSIPRHFKFYFAFLACKRKKKHGLIAICIRWYEGSSSYPRFSREAFSQYTLHSLDPSVAGIVTSPDFRSQSIWISRDPTQKLISNTSHPSHRASSIKLVRWNVLIKSKRPWSQVSTTGCHNEASDDLKSLVALSPQLPNFQTSKLPFQHLIKGSMSCRGFEYQVIVLSGATQACIDLSFGIIDTQMWLGVQTRGTTSGSMLGYRITVNSYSFPSGSRWTRKDETPYDLLIPLQSLHTLRSIRKLSSTVYLELEIVANFDDSEEVDITIALVVSTPGVRRVINYLRG
jgi:hypothetical protein